ncbi:hypothetical protein CK203_069015 [Vitis vinifera]|uniref:Uncharacterized protein n=1 Tax=Vitis vinifera TaxID=29760 RepID=A0A438F118_VITVI|nr:hypothetical protein CK203_069015 [Vitis vinifera]
MKAGSGVCLPKAKFLSYLLEGTVGSHVESIGDEEKDVIECSHDVTSAVYLALMSLQMYPSNQDPKTNPTRSVRSIRSMSGSCIPAPRSTKCNNIGVLHPHKREGGTCRLGGDDHSQLLSKVSLRAILTLERGVYLFLLGRKDPNFTIERATLYLTQRMEPLPCIGNCKGSSKWVKVNEKRTLNDVLKEPNLMIPGIPGLFFCCLIFNLIVLYLGMQFSMWFQKDPASIKSSEMESGLFHHEQLVAG